MDICGLGGFWYTVLWEEVHNHDQSNLDTWTSIGSSTCPCPGSYSNANARPDMQKLAYFDVFLNHHGPDVKKIFVSHLNVALRRVGCETFLDVESLVPGPYAFDSINHAFIGVQVHVVIFSLRYAESKYCLNELCDMLASKKSLIPMFYNVEPENLQWPENEKGPFARALFTTWKEGTKGMWRDGKELLRRLPI